MCAGLTRGSLVAVFAQMVTDLRCNDPAQKFSAIWYKAKMAVVYQNFSLHIECEALRPLSPQAHLTLHAGEQAPVCAA